MCAAAAECAWEREREREKEKARAPFVFRWKMPPKKRDKEPESSSAAATTMAMTSAAATSGLESSSAGKQRTMMVTTAASMHQQGQTSAARMDQIQADHELFLQAFESKSLLYLLLYVCLCLFTRPCASLFPSTSYILGMQLSRLPVFSRACWRFGATGEVCVPVCVQGSSRVSGGA